MKIHFLLAALSFLALPASGAVYQVGDTVTNMCWTDANAAKVCIDDYANNVKVLIYNAGWCPDCNQEMKELAPQATNYDGRPVVFLSLSAAGFKSGSQPDATFLKQWKDKYQIPFPVLASPNDPGKAFGQDEIPNVEVLDFQDKLTYLAVQPAIKDLFAQIDQLLSSR
jgi:peroxiredoxin